MAKVNYVQSALIKRDIAVELQAAEAARGELRNLYAIRRGFYHDLITPMPAGPGGDQLNTGLPAMITRKLWSYFLGNGFQIKARAGDVSDKLGIARASVGNKTFDFLYNRNTDFQAAISEMGFQAGKDGDGYIGTEIVDGVPTHYHIPNPEHVGYLYKDDTHTEAELVASDRNISIRVIKELYDETVTEQMLVYTAASAWMNSGDYGQAAPLSFANLATTMREPNLSISPNRRMGKVSYVFDYVKDLTYYLIDGRVVAKEEGALPIYKFRANLRAGMPNGIADFEEVAHLIAALDEKVSQESDTVTRGSRIKLIAPTKGAAETLQAQINWKKDQVLHISDKNPIGANTGSPVDVLKTNENVYNFQHFDDLMTNLIRTGSGLQELLQDTIAPNVSGKALQQLYQGTKQMVTGKQKELVRILMQMIKDDITVLGQKDKTVKELLDKDGNLAIQIDVRFGSIIPQEEQTHIGNIVAMRGGNVPLISDETAREQLPDFIADPAEEARRIDEETEILAKRMKAQNTVVNQVNTPGAAAPEGAPEEGLPSAPGDAGSAQAGLTPEAVSAMETQQASATGGTNG